MLKGSTAPCRKGSASSGLLRLGNRLGSIAFKAVPRVCGCRELIDGKSSDWSTLICPGAGAVAEEVEASLGAVVGR
jgi:hypothetical protein